MMLRWLLNSKSSLFSPLAKALLIFVQPLRELRDLVAKNGVVGLQEGVLLNERPDLRDDVLSLALGQASCGLGDSQLDRRAGEPRDDRRFLHRWRLELLACSLVVGLLLVAGFGWESLFVSLGRVPLARLRALSGRRGGGLGMLDVLTSSFAYTARTFGSSRADPRFLRSPALGRQSRRGAPFAPRDRLPAARPSRQGKLKTGGRPRETRNAPP